MADERPTLLARLRRFAPILARVADDRTARLLGVGVLVGALSGLAAGLLDAGIQAVKGVAQGGGLALLALSPVLAGLAAGLVLRLARDRRPTGIADVKEAVWSPGGRLSLRDGTATALAAVLTVGGGQSGGREGPIVQLAGAVASKVSRALGLPPGEARVLVAAGAAAGIAASFNTPIGAAFFALEVVLGNFAMRLFGPVVAATVTGTVVGQALLGDDTILELPGFALLHAGELPLYLILGGVCGVLGVAFKWLLREASARMAALPVPRWLHPTLAGVVVGVITLLGAEEVGGNGYAFIERLVTDGAPLAVLIALLGAKLVASAATQAGGGGAGIFAPTLVLGALTGVLFGHGAGAVWPVAIEHPGAYGMVAMGALAASVAHAPVTMTLMLFEMTGNYAIVLPLLLAVAAAGLVDAALDTESWYGMQLRARGVDLHEGLEGLVLHDLAVADIMRTDLAPLPAAASFAQVRARLLAQRGDEVFLVHEDGRFAGLVNVHDVKGRFDEELALTALDVATPQPPTLRPDHTVAEVLPRFLAADLDDLPVVDGDGRLVGVLRERDVLGTYNREVLEHDALLVRLDDAPAGGRSTDLLELPAGTSLGTVAVGPAWVGRTLADLRLPQEHRCTVVALLRAGDTGHERVVPQADTVLQAGDRAVLLGPTEAVAGLSDAG